MIKVFMLHVGNVVEPDNQKPDEYYYQRMSFPEMRLRYYSKWDITNADSQMHSLKDKGIQIQYGHFSDRKSGKMLLKAGFKLRKVISEYDPDLIHVLWGTTTALMTVFFSSKPVIISFSGSDLLGKKNASGKKTVSGTISSNLSNLAALFARKIITKSENMKYSLWPINRKKVDVIPNGINTSSFFPMNQTKCREFLKWDLTTKIVIFFDGGGAAVKNPDLAQKIIKHVKKYDTDLELKIINSVVHDELPYYYNAADAMLLTSFHEGSNNSLKEAMACNLPIVSVDCGDAKERLRDVQNSYVSKSYDAMELSDALLNIFHTSERSNGREFINEISLDSVADKIIEVYKKVIKQ